MIETVFHIAVTAACVLYVVAWGRNLLRDREEYEDGGSVE